MNVISDAAIIAPMLDGYVFVVRAGSSDKRLVQSAIDSINHVEGKILGFVLNDTNHNILAYNYRTNYYGRYYSRYEKADEAARKGTDTADS